MYIYICIFTYLPTGGGFLPSTVSMETIGWCGNIYVYEKTKYFDLLVETLPTAHGDLTNK